MKTREEVQDLKENWCEDPCYDIENTEGFEEYHDELLEYRIGMEKHWEHEWSVKVGLKATKLNCSYEMAEYIIGLERTIEELKNKLYGE